MKTRMTGRAPAVLMLLFLAAWLSLAGSASAFEALNASQMADTTGQGNTMPCELEICAEHTDPHCYKVAEPVEDQYYCCETLAYGRYYCKDQNEEPCEQNAVSRPCSKWRYYEGLDSPLGIKCMNDGECPLGATGPWNNYNRLGNCL